MPKAKRALFDVFSSILEIANKKNGANKTSIVYNANLNFVRAEEHLDLLIQNGFLAKTDDSNRYITTDKGREFLIRYKNLVDLLEKERGKR